MANRSNHQKSYSKFSPISNTKHKTNTKKKKKSRKTQLKICLESKHFKMRPVLYKHFHLAGLKTLHTLLKVFYI